ncbi:MAG TPA: pitrilysin family protein [Anaeromyxobacteraceae bacterium]|nr:pitrilysin family protein [Anaeromyxobacteraceae bacterium]
MRRAICLALPALLAACATAAPPPASTAEAPGPPPAPPPDPEAWRATPPAPGAAVPPRAPEFRRDRLENGLAVYVSEQPSMPLVTVSLGFRAGSGADPAGKAGLADLTWRLLLEGAGTRDALELADAFGELGANPAVTVERDGAAISATVLPRHAGAALALLAEMARRPRLAAADLERRKRQQLADLAARVGDPRFLAGWALSEAVYGGGHPYGHPVSGLPAAVARLTLADARRFHRENAGPATAAVILAGPVTLGEARALASKHLGAWRSPARPPPPPAALEASPRREVVLVPKPGLGQTVISMGRPALPAGHPDLEALLVANEVYGGAFSSRLNMNLREKRGYTYAAYSRVEALRGAGLLALGTSVRADVTGEALSQVMLEMRGLSERPVEDQEMAGARDGLMQRMPGTFETAERLAAAAAALHWRDLPLDHFARRVERLRSLDLPSVRSAAARWFQDGVMGVVLVGDRAVAEKQIPALAIGDLTARQPPEPPAAGPPRRAGAAGR